MKPVYSVLIVGLIVLLPVLYACSGNSAYAAAAANIGNRINCICGSCQLTVTACVNGGGCATSPKQMEFIEKELSKGLTEDQIRHDILGVYGQRALAP